MSQLPAIDSTDAALRASANGFSSLSSADFIRIIFAELANQDPFQPNDSSALLEQMSSIRNIESDIKLMDRLNSLVFENQLSSAANMLGKQVEGLTAGADRVTGVVTSVHRSGDEVILELEAGWLLPIENVTSINEPTGDQPQP